MKPPLAGWSVVVTRPAGQADGLVELLTQAGATAVAMPTIAIVDPEDGGVALRQALAHLEQFDWLILTSQNGVERVLAELDGSERLAVTRIAVIGPGTAEALARYGVAPDLVPERFIGESLVESFSRLGGSGRVMLARAAGARPVVPEGLRRLGFDVEEVEAYRAVPVAADERRRAEARQAEAITFTSSSTVHGYLAFNRKDDLPPLVATIGPVTSATARDRGIDVGAEASVHTASGLVESLAAWSVVHGRPTRPVAAPS